MQSCSSSRCCWQVVILTTGSCYLAFRSCVKVDSDAYDPCDEYFCSLRKVLYAQTSPRNAKARSTLRALQTDSLEEGIRAADDEQALKIEKALSQTLPRDAVRGNVLNTIVEQLALCQADELRRVKAWTGLKKQLAVYRCDYTS